MSMKNISSLILAAAVMGGSNGYLGRDEQPDNIDTTPKQPPIPKGCKRYEFEGVSFIATSYKSAMRKYERFLKHNRNPK